MSDEPSYKWPLIVLFILLTPIAAWTGWRWAMYPNSKEPVVEPVAQEAGDIFVAPGQKRAVSAIPASANQSVTLERCLVNMVQANDPNPPLSIRAEPSPQATVLAEVENNQFLEVVGQRGDWFAVTNPTQGWVPKALTNHSCNLKLAKIQTIPKNQSASVLGRFIGTGTHTYKLSLQKGQELSITGRSGNGLMPSLISPTKAVLFAGPENGGPDFWSGKLAETGEYQLVLESNFQGYGYAFNLDVK
jgi:hypothetical protein